MRAAPRDPCFAPVGSRDQVGSLIASTLLQSETYLTWAFGRLHARSTDLRITLVNPSGSEHLVFDGARESLATSPFEIRRSVAGSGDESVNGYWPLRVVDGRRGTRGTFDGGSITITSRWD
jgi:Proprotein convertase P-domain